MLHLHMFVLEILVCCLCLLFLSTSSIRITNKFFDCLNALCEEILDVGFYDSVCYADVNFMLWRFFPDKKIKAFIPIFLSAGSGVF